MDQKFLSSYLARLQAIAIKYIPTAVEILTREILDVSVNGGRIFLCGNGGSGANAQHIENDWSVGIQKVSRKRISIETLGSNLAVTGAISNDYSYEEVFSRQLKLKAKQIDLLIVFSGSGNSPNILRALEAATTIGMRSCAVLGLGGGKARELSDVSIHFEGSDMQIAEDLQLILGHLVMRNFEALDKR